MTISNNSKITKNDLEVATNTSTSSSCDFCQIPKSKTTKYFQDLYGNLPHTLNIPGLPSNFTVLQDLVPIGEQGGHLLLMPNSHYISLATIENQNEVETARDVIIKQLNLYFPNNPIFMFEHGPGFIEGEPIACGGCHLDHAHGHFMILPTGTTLLPIQQKMEEMLRLNGWSNLENNRVSTNEIFTNIAIHTKLNPYLQMGMIYPDGKVESFIYIQSTTDFNVASQLLRTVVSEVVYGKGKSEDWHWRDIHMGLSSKDKKEKLNSMVHQFRTITHF